MLIILGFKTHIGNYPLTTLHSFDFLKIINKISHSAATF